MSTLAEISSLEFYDVLKHFAEAPAPFADYSIVDTNPMTVHLDKGPKFIVRDDPDMVTSHRPLEELLKL